MLDQSLYVNLLRKLVGVSGCRLVVSEFNGGWPEWLLLVNKQLLSRNDFGGVDI